MRHWTNSFKTIATAYVVFAAYDSGNPPSSWLILTLLMYVCASLSIHIVKQRRLRPIFPLMSGALLVAAAHYVAPHFLLLLPISVYELVLSYAGKPGMAVIPMIVPIVYVPDHMRLEYGFVALLCFAYYTMAQSLTKRIDAYRSDIEHLHARMDGLTRSLEENNEYIRQSEYTFKLEERNRLSQEIHDKIGHAMTGALIQMEAAKRLSATDPQTSAELLQNAIRICKEGIESIRRVLKNMKPPHEQLGMSRLRLFVDAFSAEHPHIRTVLTHEGNLDVIKPIQWKIVFDNTKEALTNMLKHSNADAVSIRIRVLPALVRAEVSDNGKGSPKVIKGMGLTGMEERAAQANGTVIVDGSRGFSVTTLLPFGD